MISGTIPHYNVYETKDGKLLSLSSLEPWFFANLCQVVGREDFIPYANDQSKHEEVFSYFREVFRTKTRDEWLELLRQTDTCCAPVYTLDELASDPQIQHRKMIVEVEHLEMGKVKQPGIAVKLSKTPGAIRSLPPKFFEHTNQVMKGLGYSEEDIARLRSEGAIG